MKLSTLQPRIAVLYALLFIQIPFSVSAQNLAALRDRIANGSSEEKRTALYEIRNIGSADASRAAAAALSDPDPIVRATAAGSVLNLPQAEASAALLPVLSDRIPFVRAEAAYALGRIGDPFAVGRLVTVAGNDRAEEVRNAAIFALGGIADPSALGFLTSVLASKTPASKAFRRAAAAKAIGLIAQMQQTGKTVRVTPESFLPEKYKLSTIGNFRDLSAGSDDFRRAADVLSRILDDPGESADTRRESAFALGAVTGGKSEPLKGCAASADYYLAEICREALAKQAR